MRDKGEGVIERGCEIGRQAQIKVKESGSVRRSESESACKFAS